MCIVDSVYLLIKYIEPGEQSFAVLCGTILTGMSLDYRGTHVNNFFIQTDGPLTFLGNIAAIWRGLVL